MEEFEGEGVEEGAGVDCWCERAEDGDLGGEGGPALVVFGKGDEGLG